MRNQAANVLASNRIINSPTVEWSYLVAVGPNFYAISGPIQDSPCSSFSFLDCRTHTWVEAPMTRLAYVNGKRNESIYLPGCYENPDSLNCIQVFNTKTQTWKPVPPRKRIFNRKNMEGKIYKNSNGTSFKKGMALSVKDKTREWVGLDLKRRGFMCMIQKIKYLCKSCGEIYWFVNWLHDVRKLKGLEGLPKFARYSNVKLVDYGGKLLVLWDKYLPCSGYKEKVIWCAVIELEKRNIEEIWGKIELLDAVLEVPKSYKFVCAIAATL